MGPKGVSQVKKFEQAHEIGIRGCDVTMWVGKLGLSGVPSK